MPRLREHLGIKPRPQAQRQNTGPVFAWIGNAAIAKTGGELPDIIVPGQPLSVSIEDTRKRLVANGRKVAKLRFLDRFSLRLTDFTGIIGQEALSSSLVMPAWTAIFALDNLSTSSEAPFSDIDNHDHSRIIETLRSPRFKASLMVLATANNDLYGGASSYTKKESPFKPFTERRNSPGEDGKKGKGYFGPVFTEGSFDLRPEIIKGIAVHDMHTKHGNVAAEKPGIESNGCPVRHSNFPELGGAAIRFAKRNGIQPEELKQQPNAIHGGIGLLVSVVEAHHQLAS